LQARGEVVTTVAALEKAEVILGAKVRPTLPTCLYVTYVSSEKA